MPDGLLGLDLMRHGLTQDDAKTAMCRGLRFATKASSGSCLLCGVHSEDLPRHFDVCFDEHAPSKKPIATEAPETVQLTYRWKGVPRIPSCISEMVIDYLSFPEFMQLRCTAKHMVPAGSLQERIEAFLEDFKSGTQRIPWEPLHTRRYVSCLHNCHSARPQRFFVDHQRFLKEHQRFLEHQRLLQNCHCSCPDPLADHYSASVHLENKFKIVRGSFLKTIIFKFKPLFNPKWADRGMVEVRSNKVLWLPARVLRHLYCQAKGDHPYAYGDDPHLDFVLGGRIMRHLDEPLIKYMWHSVQKGVNEFTVYVVERRGYERRNCTTSARQIPLFIVARDPFV